MDEEDASMDEEDEAIDNTIEIIIKKQIRDFFGVFLRCRVMLSIALLVPIDRDFSEHASCPDFAQAAFYTRLDNPDL